jgi:hypothetical protein
MGNLEIFCPEAVRGTTKRSYEGVLKGEVLGG